jgi:phospholipid/cholesterol/gamma-HCH transport system substrate-binding protein
MKQNLETKVGLFLMFGIAVVCTLILFFGEVQDYFKPNYQFTVDFPNASGLLKGSDVYLSGASIGKVLTDPEPIPDKEEVRVKLKIDSNVKIREDAKFVIGSSGLLGDRFVDVQPVQYPADTPDEKKGKFITDGETLPGTQMVGIDQLTQSAEPLIEKANDIAAKLDDMITRLNDDVLSGTSTADLKETIAKLRDMVNNGDDMVKHIDDLSVQANGMVKHADEFVIDAKQGHGTLGMLINDKKTADNLRDLIANMKEHGLLFYHDDAANDKDGNKR